MFSENIHHRYALIFRDDKPVAALAMQLVAVTKEVRSNREVIVAVIL